MWNHIFGGAIVGALLVALVSGAMAASDPSFDGISPIVTLIVAIIGGVIGYLVWTGRQNALVRAESAPRSDVHVQEGSQTLDGLERLGALRTSGVLTEEEFQAQKVELLEVGKSKSE
jgi:hypothetical protein